MRSNIKVHKFTFIEAKLLLHGIVAHDISQSCAPAAYDVSLIMADNVKHVIVSGCGYYRVVSSDTLGFDQAFSFVGLLYKNQLIWIYRLKTRYLP